MGLEIERKFLIRNDSWRPLAGPGCRIRQGYLLAGKTGSIRVRLAGTAAQLTIKGPTVGARRDEFEYAIPPNDAEELLERLCLRPLIEKIRYTLTVTDQLWEIDQFEGENAGLLLAEAELASEDQALHLPDWLGPEVTADPRYFNSNLARSPYSRWAAEGPVTNDE